MLHAALDLRLPCTAPAHITAAWAVLHARVESDRARRLPAARAVVVCPHAAAACLPARARHSSGLGRTAVASLAPGVKALSF